MNQTMTSFGGVAATTTVGPITYEPARNGLGLRIKPNTKVEWASVTFPATFGYQFWLTPKNIGTTTEITILELGTASSATLRLGYDEVDEEVFLTDGSGVRLVAKLTLKNDEPVAVCIVQTPTYRKLMAGSINGEPAIAQKSAPPIGNITKMRLYWA